MKTLWFDKVKQCVGWETADQTRVDELGRCLEDDFTSVIEALGNHLVMFKDTQPLMSNARFVRRLHSVLREWLMGLLSGSFDDGYIQARKELVQKLIEVDLTCEDIILLESLARRELFAAAQAKLNGNPEALSAAMTVLDKALCLDLALIYNSYIQARDAQVERTLLDRFLAITGFSRTLYENLAEAQNRRMGLRQNRAF